MHHGRSLFFRETFIAKALDEFQGVEVVVAVVSGGGGEGAGGDEIDDGGWSSMGGGSRMASGAQLMRG